MRRVALGVMIVALLAAAGVVGMQFLGNSATTEFRWAALGDSYSSGLGEVDRPQDCARDVAASYVGRAAELLRRQGYGITLRFPACAGASLDHVFAAQSTTTSAQIDAIDATVDVVTFTLGGDDLGFGTVVSECLVRHYSGRLSTALGVDTSIWRECAVDADNPINRGAGDDGWRGIEDELVEVMTAVLAKMAPTGQVFVLSYPVLFADPDKWNGASCVGFTVDNARAFNLGVIRMGDALGRAVRRANGSTTRVRLVDWREQTSESNPWASHGLCGDETPWVHGIRVLEPGGLSTSPANSFHPTVAGYAAAAELLSKAIDEALKK